MNKLIKNLIQGAMSTDENKSMFALTDIGLMIERHTQIRYLEEDYLYLLNNRNLYNYRLKDDEVEALVHFLFFHIINIHRHPVTVVWCLGKCYNYDILQGMRNLMKIYKDDKDIHEQLVFAMTGLFGSKSIE